VSAAPKQVRHSDVAPYLYLLTTMALFGSAFTSSKVAVGQLPHAVAAFLRFGGGAVILVVLLCLRPRPARFSWRDLVRAVWSGLVWGSSLPTGSATMQRKRSSCSGKLIRHLHLERGTWLKTISIALRPSLSN
jgi:hypothetical protein